MKIISVRQSPQFAEQAIEYISSKWDAPVEVYRDCIEHSLTAEAPLPQWYLLEEGEEIIGCAGLITNDFISRMDLYPWFAALFIEPDHRGRALGAVLMEQAESDARAGGFSHVYLCTDLEGFYEKYGYEYIGTGYHPWEEESRIYGKKL